MATILWNRPLACALLSGWLLAATQAAQPRFARLGAFDGSVEVQLDAADSWRPAAVNLPLSESTRIRTGPAAKVEIELDDTSVFRMVGEGLAELSDYTRLSGGQRITVISLDHGLAYFTGEPGPNNAIHLLVPGAQASPKQGSRLRLHALEASSEVAIIEGATRFVMPSAEMDLHQGQSARVTVPDSAHFSLFREIAPLEADGWSEQLDQSEAQFPASRLDLDHAGKWITAGDYGTIWQPAPQAGWAPFREGRWVWFQSIGFTWVGAEPWGWKPYHEGRWLQHPDLGWVWVPPARKGEFSPGDVFWARSTNLAVWGPLGPGEQWNGAGPPRQFAALNVTGGTFVSGTREILPASAEELPKDLLKAFLFTAALPSPPLPLVRLTATRDVLRTRLYSPIDVTPVAPAVPMITERARPPVESDAPPVVADVAPISAEPVIAPDPAAPVSNAPIVPGIIVVTGNDPFAKKKKASTKNTSSTTSTSTTYVVPVAPRYGFLNGAGATGPAPLYQNWFQQFKEAQINYQSVGAGAGLKQLRQGLIDFAALDMPVIDAKPDSRFPLQHFPTAVTGVALIYNVPGIYDGLRLTPELLAGIYLGEIRYWNDARILAVNPRASVPPVGIVVVNHSESGAATFTWTDYLSKISPTWKAKVGASASVTWPITGLMAAASEGVAELVHQTPYSIGYVDFAWASKNHALTVAIKNHAGLFVSPHQSSITAAASATIAPLGPNAALSTTITNAPGEDSYPVASFTYLLVPQRIDDPNKRAALSDFLEWMVADGQKENTNYDFAPLPKEVAAIEKRQAAMIRNR